MAEKIIYGREFYQTPLESEITVQTGIFEELPENLARIGGEGEFAIITDQKVMNLLGRRLWNRMRVHGLSVSEPIVIKPGEESKSFSTLEYVTDEMTKREHGRDVTVVALGGGVVGDLSGVVAANYKREVGLVHVPTTLLAQVDSSIGGKSGINTSHGKNLFGRFFLPKATFSDPALLKSLPLDQIISGLGEIIKYGALDTSILEAVDDGVRKIINRNLETTEDVIRRCANFKAQIVDIDPQEQGVRKGLNFGHTLGHALEEVTDFKLSHGQAISIGMFYEGIIAIDKGVIKSADFDRLHALLFRAGLPVSMPQIDRDALFAYMKNDKKNENGQIRIAVPTRFGDLLGGGHTLIDVSEGEFGSLMPPKRRF